MQPVSERYAMSVATSARGLLMTLPAVLEGNYCQSGELRLRAEPAGIGSVPPIISLSLNGRPLLSRVIRTPQTLTIPVSAPSRISVAFLNQMYELDARMVTFLKVLPKGQAQCPGKLTGEIPAASGTWGGTQGRLYGSEPLRLLVCGSGSVVLLLQGQSSGGDFPRLRLGGVTAGREITIPTTITLSVPVNGRGNLSMQLVNPRTVSQTNSRLLAQPIFSIYP